MMRGKSEETKRGATGTAKGDPQPPCDRKNQGTSLKEAAQRSSGSAHARSEADALALRAWRTTYKNRHNGKGKH